MEVEDVYLPRHLYNLVMLSVCFLVVYWMFRGCGLMKDIIRIRHNFHSGEIMHIRGIGENVHYLSRMFHHHFHSVIQSRQTSSPAEKIPLVTVPVIIKSCSLISRTDIQLSMLLDITNPNPSNRRLSRHFNDNDNNDSEVKNDITVESAWLYDTSSSSPIPNNPLSSSTDFGHSDSSSSLAGTRGLKWLSLYLLARERGCVLQSDDDDDDGLLSLVFGNLASLGNLNAYPTIPTADLNDVEQVTRMPLLMTSGSSTVGYGSMSYQSSTAHLSSVSGVTYLIHLTGIALNQSTIGQLLIHQVCISSTSTSCHLVDAVVIADLNHPRFYLQRELYGLGLSLRLSQEKKARDEDELMDDACSICLVEPKSVVLLPCRHVCVCASCFKSIDKCPVCRGGFVSYVVLV